jgi:hypothetical protein
MRFPSSARRIAVAQESEVFPTPPFPVKEKLRDSVEIIHHKLLSGWVQQHDVLPPQQLFPEPCLFSQQAQTSEPDPGVSDSDRTGQTRHPAKSMAGFQHRSVQERL